MKHIREFPKFDWAARNDLRVKLASGFEPRAVDWNEAEKGPRPAWAEHPCHIHLGKWEDGKGFRKIKFRGVTMYAHRAAYVMHHGHDVPEGQVLDHLCRVRRCRQPHHLEPVTTRENTERGNGAWVYGQGKAGESTAPTEILAQSLAHGDPRFVPLVVASPEGAIASIIRRRPELFTEPTPTARALAAMKGVEFHHGVATGRYSSTEPNLEEKPKVTQPDHFPRRLRMFWKGWIDRLAGVPG